MDSNSPSTRALNEESIRSAFKEWRSLKALGSNPLAGLAVIESCRVAAGYTLSPMGRGLALRKVLESAIDSLKPAGESPALDEKNWRRYSILKEQFLNNRRPEWVAEQLHISKATYYGQQKLALEMLADILRKWEEERSHPSLEAPSGPDLPPAAPSPPFMAPSRPPHTLSGRDELLKELSLRLKTDSDRGLVALIGLPGVGKTTLAIETAHAPEILEHFRDGVLWAGLGRQPDIAALLGRWAAAVGLNGDVVSDRPIYGVAGHPDVVTDRPLYGVAGHPDVVSDRPLYGVMGDSDLIQPFYGAGGPSAVIAERAAAIRAAIGMRRMLLIVDDAWSAEAALAFKVGGPNCAYLLTTRLANVALDFAGDQVIAVHELEAGDGLDLVRQIAPLAVEADSEAVRSLVQMVGGLPLALIVIGRHLQKQSYHAQPRRMRDALADLQTARAWLELAQPPRPLELRPGLVPGTPVSLQSVIGLSDTALESAAHRALVALSLLAPKPSTFSEEAALAVIEAPAKVLDALVDSGLVESVLPDRYTIHQTIADYASLLETDSRARECMVDYFVRFVESHASDHPALDLELQNILAAVEAAFTANLRDRLIRLADAVYSFLELRGLYQIAEHLLCRANAAAVDAGDLNCQATCLYRLGETGVKRGQFKQAETYLERGAAIARSVQNPDLEMHALLQLGFACMFHSYDGQPYLEQALTLARESGDAEAESLALNGLGFVYSELCDYGQAGALLQQALGVAQTRGIRRCEGWADYHLGLVWLAVGEFDRAKTHLEESLGICEELGDRRGQAWDLYGIGRVCRQRGQYYAARESFEQALNIFDRIGDLLGKGLCVHDLGLVIGELGDPDKARSEFGMALEVFWGISYLPGQSHALQSLGNLCIQQGDYAAAQKLLEQALEFPAWIHQGKGESELMANLGLVRCRLGDRPAALEYGQRAVSIAREIGARPTLAFALTRHGDILADLDYLEDAAANYREAIDLRRALGQPHLVTDPLAGLARVRRIQGEFALAQSAVEEILDHVLSGVNANPRQSMAGASDPRLIIQTCVQVLEASHDPRAESLLQLADGLASVPVLSA